MGVQKSRQKLMPISHERLLSILNSFRVGSIYDIQPITGGRVSINLRITTEKGHYVARILPPSQKASTVVLEHKLLRHLNESGFSLKVPLPIMTKDGDLYIKESDRLVWLYEYIPGETYVNLTIPLCEEIARVAAEFHSYTHNISIHVKDRSISFQYSWLGSALKHLQSTLMRQKFRTLSQEYYLQNVSHCITVFCDLQQTSSKKVKSILTHGDLTLPNILFSGEKPVGIIDFDNCQVASPTRDITIFILYECSSVTPYALDFHKARLFVSEYQKHDKSYSLQLEDIAVYAIYECLDTFWWRAYQSLDEETVADSTDNLHQPLEALQWYHKHLHSLSSILGAS